MIVFDDRSIKAFYPLTLNRSVGDLRCGILKQRQRLQQLFGDEADAVWIENRLIPLYSERHPSWQINLAPTEETLFVNSRLRILPETIDAVKRLKSGQSIQDGTDIAVYYSKKDQPPQDLDDLLQNTAEVISVPNILYSNLSDLIHDNDRMIRFDFEQFFYEKDSFFETEPGVTVLHPYNVWIAENVILKPGVVLDASDGPIVLDEGVKILPNAVVTGPAYIGKNSLIKVGAKIYGGSSIGPLCKIGGEIEGSIFQAYSNKQHDGFLGHSYIGEWVNIGADTNNSDLKNTYKNVSFHSYLHDAKIDSGSIFLGALVADHVKLGINTSINTGCVIGFGSNLWGPDLISDFVPDFSWGQAKELSQYRYDAFCQTAQAVKQRRHLLFTDIERDFYRQIHSETYPAPVSQTNI